MTRRKIKPSRIILIAILILGVVLAIWYFARPKVAAPKVTTVTKAEASPATDPNKSDPTMDKKTTSIATTPTTSSQTLSIVISRPVNKDTVPLAEGIEVRSVISGATSGSCTLKGTGPNGKAISRTATMSPQTSYGSCSFDVASSEVTAGEWSLTLAASSGSAIGSSSFMVTVQ